MAISRARAEVLALQALGWLAGHENLLPVFLGASGLGAEDLRSRAEDPDVLAAVLDFLLMDDAWVVAFCTDAGEPFETLQAARAALPGGEVVHWT